MSSLREAATLALEALEHVHRTGDTQVFDLCYADKVIPALRAALAEPVPDYERGFIDGMQEQMKRSVDKAVNRMAAPPQRKPLTPEEIHNIYTHMMGKAEGVAQVTGSADFPVLFARAIEQMHGIGDSNGS